MTKGMVRAKGGDQIQDYMGEVGMLSGPEYHASSACLPSAPGWRRCWRYHSACIRYRAWLCGRAWQASILHDSEKCGLAVLSSTHADIVGQIAIEIMYPERTKARSTLHRPLFEQIHTSLSGESRAAQETQKFVRPYNNRRKSRSQPLQFLYI